MENDDNKVTMLCCFNCYNVKNIRYDRLVHVSAEQIYDDKFKLVYIDEYEQFYDDEEQPLCEDCGTVMSDIKVTPDMCYKLFNSDDEDEISDTIESILESISQY